MNPLAVSTLAEGMMQDAYNYFSGDKDSASAEKVAVFNNTDIRRLSEVGLWLYAVLCIQLNENCCRMGIFVILLCKVVHSYIPIRVVYLARPSTCVTSLAWPGSNLSVRVESGHTRLTCNTSKRGVSSSID